MELILIPPGEFEIEGEKVSLADAYYLGKTEVTQSQWAAVMGTDRGEGGEASSGNRPVAFVSWTGAMEFCERLTAKEERGTYRLPSEAEWEFACRAGTSTKYSFGEDPAELGQYAWISHNTRDAGEPFAHEVGLKKPNAFGLFDMHGNV
jgi:formylglycine-generating enzyme required for sulfatase activity